MEIMEKVQYRYRNAQGIEYLHKFFELTNDIVIDKTKDAQNFKYAELIDIQRAVDDKIRGTGFFYQFKPFGIAVFHKELDEPLVNMEIPVDDIMKFPEMEKYLKGQNRFQRILSASTYIKRCMMLAAFNLKTEENEEAQQQKANEQIDKEEQEKQAQQVAEQVYEKYATRLQNITPTDDRDSMQKVIEGDERLNDEQKASLVRILHDVFTERYSKQTPTTDKIDPVKLHT